MPQLLQTLYSTVYYYLFQVPDLDVYVKNRERLANYDLDGLTIKVADAEDFHCLAESVDKFHTSARITDRTSRSDVCVVAYKHGEIAHARWATFKPTTAWGGHRMHLAPDEAYTYDAYTIPAFRRQGIGSEARVFLLTYLALQGIRCTYTDSRIDNMNTQQARIKWVREGRARILGVIAVSMRLGRMHCTFFAETEDTRPLLVCMFQVPLHTIRIRSISQFLHEK